MDPRVSAVVAQVAGIRSVDPPTQETKQLLIAAEPDGYAAGRIGTSVLEVFLDPEDAARIAERHGLPSGPRSDATWIVRIKAADLDSTGTTDVAVDLLQRALDRVAPWGSWNRGLPDAKRARGDLCDVHFVQRSLTGACPMCD